MIHQNKRHGKHIEQFEDLINNFEIAESLKEIWLLISRTNKYIDETAPWQLSKENEQEKLKSCIYHLIENLRKIAILISPFMKDTAKDIFRQIGINSKELQMWNTLQENVKLENIKVIEKGEPIFMRLQADEEIAYLKDMMKGN